MAKRVQTKKKSQVYTYSRVSSQAQRDGWGLKRQRAACKTCIRMRLPKGGCVGHRSEVKSGCADLENRQVLQELLGKKGAHIYVESARAIARSCEVAEQVFQKAKAQQVQIISADIPSLMKLHPSPAEAFMRRMMFAYQQLERDLLVERLAHGRVEAKRTTKRRTQTGALKVAGCKSHFQRKPPTVQQIQQLKKVVQQHQKGHITCRDLAAEFQRIQRLPRLGIHTARRQVEELKRL